VNANVNISITAEMSITVDNLTAGALALQTDMAHFASFIASTGTLNFNDQLDSITTAGGDLSLVAVTSMSLGGLNSGGGDIVIQADDVDIQAAINAGAGIVTIQQSTAGRDIDLGTETGGQTSLTNAELNQVTAGVLRIGAINGGDIRVTAAITLTNVPTLSLLSVMTISDTANASLTVTNNASFTATSIDLGNQAGDIFNFSSLTFIGGGAVSITEDSLLANNLSASGSNSAPGAQVNLTVQGGGTLTVNAGNISSNNGDITLSADDMTITGTVNAGTAIVTLQQAGAAGRPIDLGTNTGGTLGLTDAELDRVTASILRIGRTDNAGAIGISAPLDTANTSTLSLRTGGAINETGTGTITVTNLNLRGAAGVNLDTNPNSVTGRLAGSTSNQRFVFVNSGTLTVGTADTQNGINLGSGTGGLRANGSAILNGLSAGNDVTAGKMGLNGMGGLGTSLSPLTLAIGMLNTISGNAPEFLSAAATTTIYSTGLNAGTGGIVLTGGTFALSANNLIQSISPVRLAGNATLNVGTFSNTIFALKLIASSTLGIQVNSFSVGHFGQLSVTGPQLLLNGATLNLTLGAGFTKPATGTTIVLIRNIGNAAIVGQFAGHAEGSTITVGGFSFRISYQGGAGHDIALTAL